MPVMLAFQIQCKTAHVTVMGMASVCQVSVTVFQDFMERIVLKVSLFLCLQITTVCVCDVWIFSGC